MSIKYSQLFKDNLVKQVLARAPGMSIKSIAHSEGVGLTALHRWIKLAQENALMDQSKAMTKKTEKRPEEWSSSERLQAIITCDSLDGESRNAYCREVGIYSHHIEQWKRHIIEQDHCDDKRSQQVIKRLNAEKKQLQKELNRKEKALAETAALLTLKKKAQALWGNDEDNV